MKIAICADYGGFELSIQARRFLKEKHNLTDHEITQFRYFKSDEQTTKTVWNRHDFRLIDAIEQYQDTMPDIAIVDIPDGTDYIIQEYDGLEHIAERHRKWYAR